MNGVWSGIQLGATNDFQRNSPGKLLSRVCSQLSIICSILYLELRYPWYTRRPPRAGHEQALPEEDDDDGDADLRPSGAAPRRRPPLPPGPVEPTDLHNYGNVCFKPRGKGEIMLNNSHVIPYNPYLTEKYQTHINVEYCLGTACVSYALKYIMKGT
jgi:hypothetical protein